MGAGLLLSGGGHFATFGRSLLSRFTSGHSFLTRLSEVVTFREVQCMTLIATKESNTKTIESSTLQKHFSHQLCLAIRKDPKIGSIVSLVVLREK